MLDYVRVINFLIIIINETMIIINALSLARLQIYSKDLLT